MTTVLLVVGVAFACRAELLPNTSFEEPFGATWWDAGSGSAASWGWNYNTVVAVTNDNPHSGNVHMEIFV